MFDKYTKIVYQSEPIGEYGIVLYLTKFDLEAYNKDQELEKSLDSGIEEINNPLYCTNNYDFLYRELENRARMIEREIQLQELERMIYQAQYQAVPMITPYDCCSYSYCRNGDYLDLYKYGGLIEYDNNKM